ncbi:MAG: SDR family NAD(P)-dependent oxidoreductase [Bacteroidia bacterium]|nr:SDR family NAD(P)-dependent oxidoreductase [Bacteroidia bacterium]
MEKIALVTGATSGIGKATALKLAEAGYSVIITGRRWHLLAELEKQLIQKSRVLALSFDVSNNDEVNHALDKLPEEWKNIEILVNNAGLAAGLSSIQNGDIEDWEKMIDTNVKGLLYVTKKIIPMMISHNRGHIINIGSIAGKEVYPMGNVYCATKFAVDALTKAMRIDLLEHNIKVTGICPGMVETEFSLVRFKGNKENANNVYNGLDPLTAEDVADVILFAITRPPHVNLNDIVITPTAQASATNVNRKK